MGVDRTVAPDTLWKLCWWRDLGCSRFIFGMWLCSVDHWLLLLLLLLNKVGLDEVRCALFRFSA